MNATPMMLREENAQARIVIDYVDPLDDDEPADDVVVTTRRAIGRVALVASETASRFQREGVVHDAMSWMFAPRALFGGSCAIDACLERDACMRGVLMHGLSLGMDAAPELIDALTADGDDGVQVADVSRSGDGRMMDGAPLRLFTATVVMNEGTETLHAFHASLAPCRDEIVTRLSFRLGTDAADARIVEGFDASDPLVEALVSPATADLLAMVAADPGSPIAAGIDVTVEQRFDAPG